MKKFFLVSICLLMAAVFIGAQDLTVDYQYNVAADDSGNYLTFAGPQRFGTANKDTFDAVTGASKQKSTALFSASYQTDIAGKAAFPAAVRCVFLYPVDIPTRKIEDNLNVTKAANGVITVQFCHRGTAYRMITDAQGRLSFPKGNYARRVIGYIVGSGPQVISRDFSSDGTAAKIDWAKVWNPNTPSNNAITGPNAPATAKTGAFINDWEDSTIFHFAGNLQFLWDGRILKINGSLRATQGAPR
ncbi:MAG: hypothetical protein FWD78_12455 [Treponema sp.]|nr:hypothetical protein [Treponema sp.]